MSEAIKGGGGVICTEDKSLQTNSPITLENKRIQINLKTINNGVIVASLSAPIIYPYCGLCWTCTAK